MIERRNAFDLTLIQANFPLPTTSHLMHWDDVKKGRAIGVAHETLGGAELSVTRVLPDLPPVSFDLRLITHEDLRTNRAIVSSKTRWPHPGSNRTPPRAHC